MLKSKKRKGQVKNKFYSSNRLLKVLDMLDEEDDYAIEFLRKTVNQSLRIFCCAVAK